MLSSASVGRLVAQLLEAQPEAQQLQLHLGGGPLGIVLADLPQVLDVPADGVEADRGEPRHGQKHHDPQVAGNRARGGHNGSIRTTCQISRRR